MNNILSEAEYRFDRVEDSDRLCCLNWEYERECRRNESEPILKPWLDLNPKERASAYKRENVPNYVETIAPVSLATPSQSQSKLLTDPFSRHLRKVVTLPPMMVNWNCSDPAILNGLYLLISEWLKEQRQNDLSASWHREKQRSAKPLRVISLLADLAVYRLRRRQKLSGQIISTTLKEFEKLNGVSPRIIQGKVFEGNLERTCRRVERSLFGKPKLCQTP